MQYSSLDLDVNTKSNFIGKSYIVDEKKIESIMCTNNIVCHKVPNPNNGTISEKKYKYLLIKKKN